jgi:hypothetical protein
MSKKQHSSVHVHQNVFIDAYTKDSFSNITRLKHLPLVLIKAQTTRFIIIIIIIIISCRRFSFFPGTSPLEPVVNPTTQASSLSL